ncbi:MAG TPA: NUDIX hydrolase [Pseudomonadales bacterium]|nr:NUDIX hydrolase [Pseudomonadales bacterium]
MSDPRDAILGLFDSYAVRYPEESETVTRIRTFVARNPDCFRRELLQGHITGSAWVVDRSRDRTLLTHHRKLDIWVQLGGHADGDPDVGRVALREAEEESGISNLALVSDEIFDIDIHSIPARGNEPEHFHYDCRFMIEARDEDYVVSDESHDLAWIDLDCITEYTTEDSMLRMRAKTSR